MSPKRRVFYSFYFDDDVFRVQQIRQMGMVDGNEPVTVNEWEEIRRTRSGIERWIDESLFGKSCVIVLIGSDTASRPWVKYEIDRAWALGKALFGIRIHNLRCLRTGLGVKGSNPFASRSFELANGEPYVPRVYDPSPSNAYADIRDNLPYWVERAISECQ